MNIGLKLWELGADRGSLPRRKNWVSADEKREGGVSFPSKLTFETLIAAIYVTIQ